MTDKNIKLHPVYAFTDMQRYIFLLVVPIVRALLNLGGSFSEWLSGIWIDLLVVLAIAALGIARQQLSSLSLGRGVMRYSRGLFGHKTSRTTLENISTLRIHYPFFLRPLRAAVILTASLGRSPKERLPLTVYYRDAERFYRAFRRSPGKAPWYTYRPGAVSIAFFSAASSSVLGGIWFFVTLISNAGSLLDRSLPTEFYGALRRISDFFKSDLPPAAVMALVVIAAGYSAAFVRGLFEYRRLRVVRYEKEFTISGGMFPRYFYSVAVRDVSSVCVRVKLVTALFGRCSLLISAPGYGGKTFLPILSPFAPVRETVRLLKRMYPECPSLHCSVRVDEKKAAPRYVRLPLVSILLLLASGGLVALLWPEWIPMAGLAVFMGSLWSLWILLNKRYALRHTGIGANDGGIVVHCEKQRSFRRVYIPYGKVVRMTLTQSGPQRKKGLCNVLIWEKGNVRQVHKVVALPVDGVEGLGISRRLEEYSKNRKKEADAHETPV